MEPLFESAPPPDLPPHLRWRTVKVPPGAHGPYMVAGSGWSGTTHYTGKRTVPCLRGLPRAKLECPYCKSVKRFACYLPFWNVGAVKQQMIVVQGAKRTQQTFSAFKVGDLINVVRGKAERDTPLIVAAKPSGPTCDLDKFRRRGPQDITRYLLHLWQWRELSEAFGELYYPSIRSVEIEAGIRTIADDPPRTFEEE